MKKLLILTSMTFPLFLSAQLKYNGNDSTSNEAIKERNFNVKQMIVPAALVGYGINALHNPTLQQANNNLKEEMWTEKPHTYFHIDNYLQYAPAATVFGLNAIGIKGKNSVKDVAGIYLLSNLMLNSVVYSTKQLTKEMRPGGTAATSFPSGHTAEAFASAELLRREYKDISPWYGVAGYAMAGATGYLRMYNNKHWLSDVCAGAGIGILSTDVAYWLYPKIFKTNNEKRAKKSIVVPTYANRAFGVAWQKTI